jgi:polysaccharide biosynthesis/export protein VpsN
MFLRALIVACGLAVTGCATEPTPAPSNKVVRPAAPASAPDLSAYRLGIGDKVRIDVFNEPDLSLEATIDPTGRISYPLLGSVESLRKTARELQDAISQGLAAGYLINPDVRVTVVQYRPFYVTGQVQRPGAYPFVVGLTVEKALALAGGMTNLASSRAIYLLREDRPLDQRVRVVLDAAVLPGDTLLVEESLF